MNMRRFVIINSMALSLLGASIASAQSTVNTVTAPINKINHHRQQLTPQQRVELVKIKKNLRAKMLPLLKEKQAISVQIRGKIATPNTQWSTIASLVAKRNAVNEKISTLRTKTQLETFQKLGIMLPHHKHHGCVQNNKWAKK